MKNHRLINEPFIPEGGKSRFLRKPGMLKMLLAVGAVVILAGCVYPGYYGSPGPYYSGGLFIGGVQHGGHFGSHHSIGHSGFGHGGGHGH